MDLIGTCSVASWKKTLKEYLESRGIIEKPTPFLQTVKDHFNHALIATGLMKPEPTILDTPPEVVIVAVLMVIFTVIVITKCIIARRNKKMLSNLSSLMGQSNNNGHNNVDDFFNGLSNNFYLPEQVNFQEVRGLLGLFEKYLMKKGQHRRAI